MTITLRDIDKDNWEAATNLKLAESQKTFVAVNWYSMLQVLYAKAEVDLVHKGIYHDEEMVGYTMMGQIPGKTFITRLMIDEKHQNKGYGRAAMNAIIADLKARYNPDSIFISFEPENTVARKLYESLGFVDTGEVKHGELVFRLPLK
jgi:diamine N-acetyltransferase